MDTLERLSRLGLLKHGKSGGGPNLVQRLHGTAGNGRMGVGNVLAKQRDVFCIAQFP